MNEATGDGGSSETTKRASEQRRPFQRQRTDQETNDKSSSSCGAGGSSNSNRRQPLVASASSGGQQLSTSLVVSSVSRAPPRPNTRRPIRPNLRRQVMVATTTSASVPTNHQLCGPAAPIELLPARVLPIPVPPKRPAHLPARYEGTLSAAAAARPTLVAAGTVAGTPQAMVSSSIGAESKPNRYSWAQMQQWQASNAAAGHHPLQGPHPHPHSHHHHFSSPFSTAASRVLVVNPMQIVNLSEHTKSRLIKFIEAVKRFSEQWFSHVLLLLFLAVYACFGAYIFISFEAPTEQWEKQLIIDTRQRIVNETWIESKTKTHQQFQELVNFKLEDYERLLARACASGMTSSSLENQWTFWGALFYSMTVFTTIGYGHLTPVTFAGRVATMIYAIFGIPILLMVLADLGKLLTRIIKFAFRQFRYLYNKLFRKNETSQRTKKMISDNTSQYIGVARDALERGVAYIQPYSSRIPQAFVTRGTSIRRRMHLYRNKRPEADFVEPTMELMVAATMASEANERPEFKQKLADGNKNKDQPHEVIVDVNGSLTRPPEREEDIEAARRVQTAVQEDSAIKNNKQLTLGVQQQQALKRNSMTTDVIVTPGKQMKPVSPPIQSEKAHSSNLKRSSTGERSNHSGNNHGQHAHHNQHGHNQQHHHQSNPNKRQSSQTKRKTSVGGSTAKKVAATAAVAATTKSSTSRSSLSSFIIGNNNADKLEPSKTISADEMQPTEASGNDVVEVPNKAAKLSVNETRSQAASELGAGEFGEGGGEGQEAGGEEGEVEGEEEGDVGVGVDVDVDEDDDDDELLEAGEFEDDFDIPVSFALFLLVTYMMFGAVVFSIWEGWNFFDSLYFVFISMSTIGFGDLVPQHPKRMIGTFIYLLFGLALTSMCINVVQEKIHATFLRAKMQIGEKMGLDLEQIMADDYYDGSMAGDDAEADSHSVAVSQTNSSSAAQGCTGLASSSVHSDDMAVMVSSTTNKQATMSASEPGAGLLKEHGVKKSKSRESLRTKKRSVAGLPGHGSGSLRRKASKRGQTMGRDGRQTAPNSPATNQSAIVTATRQPVSGAEAETEVELSQPVPSTPPIPSPTLSHPTSGAPARAELVPGQQQAPSKSATSGGLLSSQYDSQQPALGSINKPAQARPSLYGMCDPLERAISAKPRQLPVANSNTSLRAQISPVVKSLSSESPASSSNRPGNASHHPNGGRNAAADQSANKFGGRSAGSSRRASVSHELNELDDLIVALSRSPPEKFGPLLGIPSSARSSRSNSPSATLVVNQRRGTSVTSRPTSAAAIVANAKKKRSLVTPPSTLNLASESQVALDELEAIKFSAV